MSNQQGSKESFGGTLQDCGVSDAEQRFAAVCAERQKAEYARVFAAYSAKIAIAEEVSEPSLLGARIRNASEAIQLAFTVGPTGDPVLSDRELSQAIALHAELLKEQADDRTSCVSEGVSGQ